MSKSADPFFKHVVTLLIGNGVAQAVPILASLLLSRVYAPADMGVYALYMLLPTNLSVLATGRYDLAIVLPKEDEDALNLVALATLISLGFAALALLIVIAFRGWLSEWLHQPAAFGLLLLVPPSVFLTGAVQSAFAWLNRKKAYHFLSIGRIAQSIVTVFTTVSLGYVGLRLAGLVIGSLAGQVVSAIAAIVYFQLNRSETPWRSVGWTGIKRNARAYEDFPKVNSFHVLLDVVQNNVVTIGIGRGFGQVALGYYSFTTKVLKTPLGLIGSAVSQVFYQRASQTVHEGGDLRVLMRGVVKQLSVIAVPMCVVLLAAGPPLFALVFGANWRTAGTYAQILVPWLALNFIVSPISAIYLLMGKQKQALVLGAIDLTTKALTLGLGLLLHSVQASLLGMSIAGVLQLTYGIYWCFAIARPARPAPPVSAQV
ncbi:MAG TPA: oligosaccharide flippase family protein [Polyangiales bacterium]